MRPPRHPHRHADHARRPGGARLGHPGRRQRLPGEGLLDRGDRLGRAHGGERRDRPVAPAGGRRCSTRSAGWTSRANEEDRVVTKREEEVLQLIADGCSTPEVAEQLYISQKTVKNHLASIYQKLDARDRTQAVLQAVRMGIVHLD